MRWIKEIKVIELKENPDCSQLNKYLNQGWSIVTVYTPTQGTLVIVIGTAQLPKNDLQEHLIF
jgi:hypothetical protein